MAEQQWGKWEPWKPGGSWLRGTAPGAGLRLMLEWDAVWRRLYCKCLPKDEGWGGMQVSGGTALLALVLARALWTQLQAQLRTGTGSDIE